MHLLSASKFDAREIGDLIIIPSVPFKAYVLLISLYMLIALLLYALLARWIGMIRFKKYNFTLHGYLIFF